jgi:hypothetical protein
MRAGVSMSHHQAKAPPAGADRPSVAARMICSAEIRNAVAKASGSTTVPEGKSTWSDQLYTCTYALAGGRLQLSVEDSADLSSGERYFTELRAQAVDARPIRGLANFGLPSYRTPAGTVVFLKDGKTLTVDASELPSRGGRSAGDVAYAVAASVVACWTE